MASSYFMSATAEKTQRMIMIFMPLIFVGFILKPPVGGTAQGGGFPIGLLIYWVTTNLWTVGQGLVTRQLTPKPAPPPKRSSRTPSAATTSATAKKKTASPNGAKAAVPAQPQVRRVKRKKGGK
jgi:YidC/Oxa1 family membrane protein insertase